MNIAKPSPYSIRNNYEYVDKPVIISVLDVLSTPVRRLLNGRNISTLSLKEDETLSATKRICLVAFVTLGLALPYVGIGVLALAALSILAFTLKAAILPWFWQKHTVQREIDNTSNAIQKTIDAFDQKIDDLALEELAKRPKMARYKDLGDKLEEHLYARIEKGEKLENLSHLISLLPRKQAIHIVKKAIESKLKNDPSNFEMRLSLSDFIDNSLRFKSTSTVSKKRQEAYEKIISLFKINDSDKPLLNYCKVVIADELIEHFKHAISTLSERPPFVQKLRLEVVTLSNSDLYKIFNSPQEIRNLSLLIKQYDELNHYKSSLLKGIQETREFSLKNLDDLIHDIKILFKASTSLSFTFLDEIRRYCLDGNKDHLITDSSVLEQDCEKQIEKLDPRKPEDYFKILKMRMAIDLIIRLSKTYITLKSTHDGRAA